MHAPTLAEEGQVAVEEGPGVGDWVVVGVDLVGEGWVGAGCIENTEARLKTRSESLNIPFLSSTSS